MPYIGRLWKIAEAAEPVRDVLDRGLIGVGVAFELSRLPHHAQQMEVIGEVQTFSYTVKDAHDLVDRV